MVMTTSRNAMMNSYEVAQLIPLLKRCEQISHFFTTHSESRKDLAAFFYAEHQQKSATT